MLVGVGFAQQVALRPAPTVRFPSETDSNSPAFWDDHELVLYNSTGLGPVRSTGSDEFDLSASQPVVLGQSVHKPYWIESAWRDGDGTVFAWYHHEPPPVCKNSRLTAPEIGALISRDGGHSFEDLGIIITSGFANNCDAQNGYFAGGNGDFTVALGRKRDYFYFLFSNYGGPTDAQGVAIARMPFHRRHSPHGSVEKYHSGAWLEPGIGGLVTPIFSATVPWESPNADSFWGPSVHFNTYLKKFVMLLNRSCCSPWWPQEGVYVSFNDDLSNPAGWTAPSRIFEGGSWYPQVLGNGQNGTDAKAGRVARFYMNGASNWQIVFTKDEN